MKQFLIALISLVSVFAFAQNKTIVEDYNRSSLYLIPVLHPGTGMYDDIYSTACNLEIPERYNDHRLSMQFLTENKHNLKSTEEIERLKKFCEQNQIAKRMVSKWFDRDKETGTFNVELIKERGNYNASANDIKLSSLTTRGKAMLEDAGEQLIGQTFVIFNDISYIDKEAKAQSIAGWFQIVGSVAGAAGNVAGKFSGGEAFSNYANLTKSFGELGNSVSDAIAGFTVDVHSYLFKLHWDDETAATFYNNYYFDNSNISPEKKNAYENDKTLFKLEYIGDYSAKSTKTVMRGLKNPKDVFHKVMTRAIDKNIVELQHKYDVFKVTAPLAEITNDGKIKVQIGLKEGVNPKSKYEVIERKIDNDGKISYQRKAIITPVKDKIWDNRCMSVEEEAQNADIEATYFDVKSGILSELYPGMLVREIK